MKATGVSPSTGTVTPAITELVTTMALTVTTYVASVEPTVAVYVPTPEPGLSESETVPVDAVRVTSCGVPLVTDVPVTLVLVSAVKVHVPPLTEIVVDGSDPVEPDLLKSI